MIEFTIQEANYRANKMNAMTQFHCMRRIAPIIGKIAAVGGADIELIKDESGDIKDFKGDIEAILTPLTIALRDIPDEDVEYIFDACLSVTERKQNGAWCPLRSKGVTMFDDLSLAVLLQVAWFVLKEGLSGFFSELPSLSGVQKVMGTFVSNGSVSRPAKTGS